MTLEVSIKDGEATLSEEETRIWEALSCTDLEVSITVKRSKDLRGLTRKNRSDWPPEVTERDRVARRQLPAFGDALHPEIVYAMMSAVMSARVERNMLIEAAAELLSADDEDEAEVALANLIADIRERNQLT